MEETAHAHGNVSIERITAFLKRPVVLIFVLGILIRLLISPFFSVNYDFYFWGIVIENIQAGEGLYGSSGYYYTPVWGYLLGILTMLQDVLVDIPVIGNMFAEAASVEVDAQTGAVAVITTVGFNVSVKVFLFIADILVGYLIYLTIKDHTDNVKKATMGFALWFLCPVTIAVSSVGGMFDAFSVLFTLATVLLMYRSQYFLAGAMFALAVFTKFFPGFLIFFLVAYILKKHRDDGTAWKQLALAVIGACVMVLILYIPLILEGTVTDSISFLTNRVEGGDLGTGLGPFVSYATIIAYISIMIVCALVAWKYYKNEDLSFQTMTKYLLISTALIFLFPPAPQYVLLLLPFLVMYIVMSDRGLMRSWTMMSIFVTLAIFTSNFTLLLSFGAYTDIVSLESVVYWTELYRETMIFGIHTEAIIYLFIVIPQYFSVVSILYLLYKRGALDSLRSHSE